MEGVWIALGQFAAMAGSLALVRILTGYLDLEQYGQLALTLTLAGLAAQLVTGGLAAGIARHYPLARERDDLPSYLSAARKLFALAVLVICGLGGVAVLALALLNRAQWVCLVLAALALSIVGGANGILNGIQTAARQRPVVALHSGSDAWLRIALALGIAKILGPSSVGVVWGYALSGGVITFSQLLFLRRLLHRQIPGQPNPLKATNWIAEMWKYSWPFSAWGPFTWAQQSSDRWALQAYTSTAAVGAYSVVFQLGYAPISLASGLFVTLVGPILHERSGGADDPERNREVHNTLWKITGLSVAMTMAAFALTYILHAVIFSYFVAPPYRQYSPFLPWMVLAGGFSAASQILIIKKFSEFLTRQIIPVRIATAVASAILIASLTFAYGLTGTVVAMVLSSLLSFVWICLISLRPVL